MSCAGPREAPPPSGRRPRPTMAGHEMAEMDAYLQRKNMDAIEGFDPKGYKKLVNNIGGIKDSLEAERADVERRIQKIMEEKDKNTDQHKSVQLALGKQVQAANRGYQMMLSEFQGLHREYGKLHEDFSNYKEKATEEARLAALELHKEKEIAKEGYAKREEQIKALELVIPELKVTISGQDRVIVELKEAHSKEVANWDMLLKDARASNEELKLVIESEKQRFIDREVEMSTLLSETDKVRRLIIQRKQAMDELNEQLTQSLEEEKKKVAALQYQIDNDDTEERTRKECEEDFKQFIELKNVGYRKLMKDFVTMQEASVQQINGIREEARGQIDRLESQLAAKVLEHDTMKERLEKKLHAKEEECSKLLRKLMTVTQREEERRVEEASGGGEWNMMLNVAKKALADANEENERLRNQMTVAAEAGTDHTKNYERKIKGLENNLAKLAQSVEIQLAAKDEEVKRVMKGIHTMRAEVDAERARSDEKEKMWLERVEAKEIAYDRLLGEIAVLEQKLKRAEEYSVTVWAKVRVKEREIVAQMMKYEEKLEDWRIKCDHFAEERKLIEQHIAEARKVTGEQRAYFEKVIEDQKNEFVEVEKQLRMEIAELNQTIKEKQQEIFDLMKEMERKELEFKKREEELLATIKEREREIDQLKTEMKYRIEQLQAEIDELQASYDLLKRKYDSELTGDNSVQSLKQTLDRLQKQLRDMQAKLEALMKKVKELRQIIREKDFLIEDIKRECADIVLKKEHAYQALLKDLNKIRDEIDEERKALQRKFYEMGQEFKRQKTVYEERLRSVEEELEKEKQTHLIVAKLKEEIEDWKVKFAEEVHQREIITRDLRETARIKEDGIQRLIKGTFGNEGKIEELKKKNLETIDEYEEKAHRKERSWIKKEYDWGKQEKALRLEMEKLVYALNDPEKVKQQKARLEEERKVREKMQATIDIQAKELSAAQIAVKEMATENTDMRGLLGEKKGELGKESQLLEKRLEKQQQRFKRLMMENENT